MLEINLTKHARKRLRERDIKLTQIKETVLGPDKWFYGEEEEINAIKDFGKRKLRVVYMPEPKSVKVITVMWL
ncbi:MAG: DUF4258 domain-containing protein [Candidatus Aquicultor sp.]|nr:DUF4258 domain-containing protein [Candidatus Aquicultor sp.]